MYPSDYTYIHTYIYIKKHCIHGKIILIAMLFKMPVLIVNGWKKFIWLIKLMYFIMFV